MLLWIVSEKIFHSAQEVFADVADEYASISLICKKIADWRQKYPDSFDTAYAGLYLPKLLVPLVRLHLVSSWNPCEVHPNDESYS